jgi:two-component system sensor histidine kinase BaeS
MRKEIERVSRMIDDLFVLAQIDAGALTLDRRQIDLGEIAADVVDAMQVQASGRGVSLNLDSPRAAARLDLDGSRMERAVANLVRNALEHTPRGGTVRVEIRESDRTVLLSVSDTGEGIRPQDLEQIWNRFYRGERSRHRVANGADGAGLGLAIVRGIVEAHGGTVSAESVLGQGAVFTMSLPR